MRQKAASLRPSWRPRRACSVGMLLRFPPFRPTCELADTKPSPSDFCFPRGIEGLTPPGGTCLVQHASWPPPKSRGEGFYPPRPSPSLRTRARAAGALLQTGRTHRGPGTDQSDGGAAQQAPSPSPAPCSRLRVCVWVLRPPQDWENLAVGRSRARQQRGGATLLVPESFKLSHTGAVPRSYLPVCSQCSLSALPGTLVICFKWAMLLLNCNLEVRFLFL